MDISSSVHNASGVKTTEDPAIPPCLNDYCISNEEYLGIIEVYIYPTTFEWVLIALYIVIFIIGLGGNFLVCFAVLGNKQMRTISNLFLLNLSGCDFLVTLICLPTTVLSDVTDTWYMGNAFCKFVQYLQVRIWLIRQGLPPRVRYTLHSKVYLYIQVKRFPIRNGSFHRGDICLVRYGI